MKLFSKLFGKRVKNVSECAGKCENDAVKAKDIIGKTVISAGHCDKCPFEQSDCVKVYVKGIGEVCLK